MKLKIAFLLIINTILFSCMNRTNNISIDISPLPNISEQIGTISKGISGAYAGMLDRRLILAGGCNFPDEPAAKGGEKIYYKEILQWDSQKWIKIGELPEPMAYGVALPWDDKLLLIAGNNSEKSSNKILSLSIKNDSLQIDTLTTTPFAVNNFAATMANERRLYLFGGVMDGQLSNELWTLDIPSKTWKRCAALPDRPLQQSQIVFHNEQLYLFGGFDVPNETQNAYVSQKIWKYTPTDNQWEMVATYPKGENNYSLSGGCAVGLDQRYILTLAGVNQKVFEKALDTFFYLEKSADTSTPKYENAKHYKQAYMHHDVEWYAFNPKIYLFDTQSYKWILIAENQQIALAGATITTMDENTIALLNGEIKPGVRTPKNWTITKTNDIKSK